MAADGLKPPGGMPLAQARLFERYHARGRVGALKAAAEDRRLINVWVPAFVAWLGLSIIVFLLTGATGAVLASAVLASLFAVLTVVAAIDMVLAMLGGDPLVFDPPFGRWDWWPWPIFTVGLGSFIGWKVWG